MGVLIAILIMFSVLCGTVYGRTFSQCNGIPKGTFISGESGCASYIYCDAEDSFEDFCPLELLFNSIHGVCDDPHNVECSLPNLEELDSKDHNVVCPPSNGGKQVTYLSSTNSCSEYYMCFEGNPILLTCPLALEFNVQIQKCDLPEFANCELPGHSRPTTPAQTSPTTMTTKAMKIPLTRKPGLGSKRPPPNALKSPPGKAPPPIKATKAPNGPPTRSKAGPPGPPVQSSTLTLKTTTPSGIVTTVGRLTSHTPEVTSEPQTTESPLTTINLTPVPNTTEISTTESGDTKELCARQLVGMFPYPNDCRYYYRCAGGMLTKQQCPNGFGWDRHHKSCTATGCST